MNNFRRLEEGPNLGDEVPAGGGPEPKLADIIGSLVPRDDLARARALVTQTGDSIDVVCTRLGLCAESALVLAIQGALGIGAVSAAQFPASPVANDEVNVRFLRTARALPIAIIGNVARVAMVDPTDSQTLRGLAFALSCSIVRFVCSATDFEAAWGRLYGNQASQITAPISITTDGELERLRELSSDAPTIRYVNQILARAIDLRASDVHIEPIEHKYRIRFRLDGILQEIESQPISFGTEVISRLKIMGRINIAERRLAQDGRFRVNVRGQDVDLRMATTPTLHGEAAVLRILDRDHVRLDLTALELSSSLVTAWTSMLDRPHGILLVTGPTGSGKSTSLYASLVRLNRPQRKILTIEDPVEQQIDGLNQVNAQPAIGFGFGAALRAFLRHDPDVIMVGEIRDQETARTAIQAALTGHLILSTLHTNDAVSGITRLLDIGVDPYLISATLHGILAQRLVRRRCQVCRPETQSVCNACGGTGFRGRLAIGELATLTPAMRVLIEQNRGYDALREQAIIDGMIPIFEDGIKKVNAGLTTRDEIVRVTLDA